MTKHLYKCLDPAFNSKEEWESKNSLSSDAKVELDFWRANIRKLNGFSIKGFFTQKFTFTDNPLINPHPVMLYDELLHASQFNCKSLVVMHLWAGYPPYKKKLLLGGHLPSFCKNSKTVMINLKPGHQH